MSGGVVFSEEIDGFNVDGGPDALLIQKPDGIKLCQELGLGARLVTTKEPRLAYIQRGGRLHALPAASVMGIPTEWGPFITTRLFSWPGKNPHGHGDVRAASRVDRRRVDRVVHAAPLRQRGGGISCRTAARRHSSLATSIDSRFDLSFRAFLKPSNASAACSGISARIRRRVPRTARSSRSPAVSASS
ncbi:MAG: FAD-dependent oxidoreductase [Vicinamibacterales bacterium]